MASDPNDEKLVELEKKVDRRKEHANQFEHQQAKARATWTTELEGIDQICTRQEEDNRRGRQ
jgi:hypothetical protein